MQAQTVDGDDKGQCTACDAIEDGHASAVQLPLQRLSFSPMFVGH
jgi:hypothetical protein